MIPTISAYLFPLQKSVPKVLRLDKSFPMPKVSINENLPLFVSYAQIAIAKVPTTIRINPASAFLLNFSLNTK